MVSRQISLKNLLMYMTRGKIRCRHCNGNTFLSFTSSFADKPKWLTLRNEGKTSKLGKTRAVERGKKVRSVAVVSELEACSHAIVI